MAVKRYWNEIARIVKEDWLLMLVALVLASIIWWNSTQRQTVRKFLPGVEVNLQTNLKPSLRVVSPLRPRVSVYVEGPRAFMESLTSDDFQINADLSDIQDATKHYVFLKPEDFVPKSHLVRALPVDQISVSKSGGFMPQRIEVETAWNKGVAKIVPRIGGRPASGYIISGSSVTPATLTVAGSDADLEQHKIVRTKTVTLLNGESHSLDRTLTLKDLDLGNLEVLGWGPDDPIRFHIDIEPRFMEKTFAPVAVVVLNATQETRNYDFEPKNFEVKIQGFRDRIRSVTNTSFALGVDSSLLPSGTTTLEAKELTVLELPAGCTIVAVTPAYLTIRVWEPEKEMAPYRESVLPSDDQQAYVHTPTPSQIEVGETAPPAPVPTLAGTPPSASPETTSATDSMDNEKTPSAAGDQK